MHKQSKELGRYLPSAGRFLESRASARVTVPWEDTQTVTANPFPPLLTAFTDEHDIIQYRISLLSAGPAASPPKFSCTPSLLADGRGKKKKETKENLSTVQVLLSSGQSTGVLPTVF